MPLSLAELVARVELAHALLHTTDWSTPRTMAACVAKWPGRTADAHNVGLARIAHWHGEEVVEIKRAVMRTARGGAAISPESAQAAVAWRARYLRKALLEMANEAGLGIDAADMLENVRLTFGAPTARAPRWYAVHGDSSPNPHALGHG